MTTSLDGRTWSNPDIIGYSVDWYSIAFACGKYVAAGNGYIAVSADGTNWSINKISNTNNRTWNDVQYCNGHFIVVGNSEYIVPFRTVVAEKKVRLEIMICNLSLMATAHML